MEEFFGKPISVYTSNQAVEDGILMKNQSNLFLECNLITSNLFNTIKELDDVMIKANDVYIKEKFTGDNDKDFFVIKNEEKTVWFVRNEYRKLTGMLPSDY